MKITKYPQSTLLLEKDGVHVLMDPGSFTMEKYDTGHFGALDAILLTHSHFDHLHQESIRIWSQKGVSVFGNQDVVRFLKNDGIDVKLVENYKSFSVGFFEITPIDLPHSKMVDGTDGPPNTGFLIDRLFFHPGDGIEIKALTVENAAVPITGPTINYENAWKFARDLQAKKIIPIHYSNSKYSADPKEFAKLGTSETTVIVLGNEESTVI